MKVFKFSNEKVLKKYGKWFLKMCGNPDNWNVSEKKNNCQVLSQWPSHNATLQCILNQPPSCLHVLWRDIFIRRGYCSPYSKSSESTTGQACVA